MIMSPLADKLYLDTPLSHTVLGRNLAPPYPENQKLALIGMGCFWGVERYFWQQDGVWVTAVGYGMGHSQKPDYRQVCTKDTGHVELVLVVYDPAKLAPEKLIQLFLEGHDPTQGNRQGNDMGPQYRSALLLDDADGLNLARTMAASYGDNLKKAGFGAITSEIALIDKAIGAGFWLAEDYHQQYLDKNPDGYCALKGTGISCTNIR